MEDINNRIDLLIKDLGITKTRFAESLHVSSQFISSLCSGAKQPSERTISDICREFNVSLDWLQSGNGEMYVQRSANEELGLMVASLMAEADESFRKRFVSAMLELPPEFWPELEKFIKKIAQDD
ncbi:MAG: helix-turn-helix transcriptional regulator [Oscillospiraceae bacterium]|jgi:transcriptional regulator with XRE-family HTH domain